MSFILPRPRHRRAQIVESLYGDRGSFLLGGLAVGFAAAITASRIGSWLLWVITVAIVVMTLLRLLSFELFLANERHAERHPQFWNRLYSTLGTGHLALIGLWMAAVFTPGSDYFSEILSLVVSIGFLIGTQGRNFSNLTLVKCQFVACLAPPLFAIYGHSQTAALVLGLFVVAFYFAVVRTSTRIHRMLQRAIEASEENWRLAHTDALTGLANRVSMQTTVRRAVEERVPFALMIIDLDHFARVNETLGQLGGDHVLRQAALSLEAIVGPGGVTARSGSDEFWVMQLLTGGSRTPEALAGEIVRALGRPAIVNGVTMPAGCSIGIARHPEDGESFETLLHRADMALFEAKTNGKGRFLAFREGTPDRAAERLRIESDLRRAVQNGEVVLHYQPIVANRSLRIVGCEALARWEHPTRGLVSPGEFLPVAEDAGLMDELTNQALLGGCTTAAGWPDGISVSLNLSPSQLRRSDLVPTIAAALKASGLDPHRLELEITENILLDEHPDVMATLQGIRALGIGLSLDDFGTGYSNLGQIGRLPIDKIKLDKTFLVGVGEITRSTEFLRGAIQFIAPLGFEIVLEGVETEQQIAFARAEAGVSLLQGYAFGRAMPAAAIEPLLQKAIA